jgi:hypothetical protein
MQILLADCSCPSTAALSDGHFVQPCQRLPLCRFIPWTAPAYLLPQLWQLANCRTALLDLHPCTASVFAGLCWLTCAGHATLMHACASVTDVGPAVTQAG